MAPSCPQAIGRARIRESGFPMIDRRQFGGGVAALAFLGLARRGWTQAAATAAPTYRNEVPGYGPLIADPTGLFDLPEGFRYSIVSVAGEAMDDGYVTPGKFDGMACFPLGGRRVALVRNHELRTDDHALGPAGGLARLEQRLRGGPAYGRGLDGRVLPGGTSTIVYDLRRGRRERHYLSLAGTAVNCAGGATPWGSWLSCEEVVIGRQDAAQEHGWVFEVPARQPGLVTPRPLAALGRFKHEAAAVDPATGIVYLTEDRDDSLFYRMVPRVPGQLQRGGRLQALALRDRRGADTRNWNDPWFRPGETRDAYWIDLDETASPNDDLRGRGHAAGAARFARGEGVHWAGGDVYFCCTSGGAARHGQIMRYRPGRSVGGAGAARADRLQLFVESADRRLLDYADNLTATPWGHLIVCEDIAGAARPNHLKGMTPAGRIYTLARLNARTELAGVCFSPDAATMFVNVYHPGRTLAITGPWRRFRAA
jgi:secreted PhoX family phosphatase